MRFSSGKEKNIKIVKEYGILFEMKHYHTDVQL